MKFLIVGLGNPGRKYERTRHNAGFMAVDEIGRRLAVFVDQERNQAVIARVRLDEHDAILVKPQTYMNESGRAVSALLRDSYLSSAELIVIHDELDLPLGAVRIKSGGGHGGHNGLRSIIEWLGTPEFIRIRVGIGRPAPGMEAADYVLSPFLPDERQTAAEAITKAADAVVVAVSQGLTKALNLFNQK